MPNETHDIVVIGTSAGGVEALTQLAERLPKNLPASIFAVLHTAPESPFRLPEILSKRGPLKTVVAHDGQVIERSVIYLAAPDHHLLLEKGHVRVVRGPKENRFRPAIDPLFRSAALVYATRVVGVVLTGNLDDGAAGLCEVKRRGGLAVVQDPDEAQFPSMPESAMKYVIPDHIVRLAEMGPLLGRLARKRADDPAIDLLT